MRCRRGYPVGNIGSEASGRTVKSCDDIHDTIVNCLRLGRKMSAPNNSAVGQSKKGCITLHCDRGWAYHIRIIILGFEARDADHQGKAGDITALHRHEAQTGCA